MSFNSNEWSWKDMSVYINGARVSRIKRAIHKTSAEKEALFGAGNEAFAVGSGNKLHTGELELYSSTISEMNKAARAMGFSDLTDVPWTLVLHFKPTITAPQETITVPEVHFTEFEIGGANNDKSFAKTIPYASLAPVYA